MSEAAREDVIPFPSHTDSVDSTDEFEIYVPPSMVPQKIGFRFFAKSESAQAGAGHDASRLVLPSKDVLLVSIQPAISAGPVARSLPI